MADDSLFKAGLILLVILDTVIFIVNAEFYVDIYDFFINMVLNTAYIEYRFVFRI